MVFTYGRDTTVGNGWLELARLPPLASPHLKPSSPGSTTESIPSVVEPGEPLGEPVSRPGDGAWGLVRGRTKEYAAGSTCQVRCRSGP